MENIDAFLALVKQIHNTRDTDQLILIHKELCSLLPKAIQEMNHLVSYEIGHRVAEKIHETVAKRHKEQHTDGLQGAAELEAIYGQNL